MSEIIDKMLSRPIATIVVTSCIAGGIARIISAAKGNGVDPVVNINVQKPTESNT